MTCAHAHTRTHTPHDPGPHPRPPKPPLRTPASQQERRVRLGRFISVRFASGPLWGTGLPRPPVGGWGYVRSAAGSRAVVWTAASGFCGARLRSGLAGVRLGRAGCRVEGEKVGVTEEGICRASGVESKARAIGDRTRNDGVRRAAMRVSAGPQEGVRRAARVFRTATLQPI